MVPLLVERVKVDYCMSSAWDGPMAQSECCINVKCCYLNSLRAFKNLCVYIYIYLWLCWVFSDVQTSSSFDEQGYSLVVVRGPLIVVAFLVVERRLWATWASVLWCTSLVPLQNVESPHARD